MEKLIKRKVKRGKAKDFKRNAKYFYYYYITYNNQNYILNLNGWNEENNLEIQNNFVFIENQKILLVY